MNRVTWILASLCCLVLVGCGPQGPAVAPVSGTVTLDGRPLVGASLSFQPVTDKTNAAQGVGSWGKTDNEGRYTLRLIDPDKPGAMVGQHEVTIATAMTADPASDDLAVMSPERLPLSARTHMFDVPAEGTDQANFDLKSK